MIAAAPPASIILDVAPSTALSDLIRASSAQTYVSIDVDPAADGRRPDLRASITRIPLRTGSVGFLLCSHVLEHVPDDRSAMLEIARVLAPGAAALIQVPRRKGAPTDEDLTLSPNERAQRYGQADHVRLYGNDFEERLDGAGLNVASTTYSRLLPRPLLETIGVFSDHELWVATTSGDPTEPIDPDSVIGMLARSLLEAAPGHEVADAARVRELERKLDVALHDAETWRSNYEWLRNRPLIRVATKLRRLLGRLPRGRPDGR